MERINGLCRVLAVCALIFLIALSQFELLKKSEAAKQAEEVFAQQIYEIQTALNKDHKKKIVLFETGSLSKDYSQEQLDQMISAWIKKAANGRTYSKEAISEIQKEIAALYKKQKEIAADPLYSTASGWIINLSVAVLIICNLNIILVHTRRRKVTCQKQNNPANETTKCSDALNSDKENIDDTAYNDIQK